MLLCFHCTLDCCDIINVYVKLLDIVCHMLKCILGHNIIIKIFEYLDLMCGFFVNKKLILAHLVIILYCYDLFLHYHQVVDRLSLLSPGVQAYADALLIIPKVLAQNSGLDAQDTIVKLQEEYVTAGQPVGLDIVTG